MSFDAFASSLERAHARAERADEQQRARERAPDLRAAAQAVCAPFRFTPRTIDAVEFNREVAQSDEIAREYGFADHHGVAQRLAAIDRSVHVMAEQANVLTYPAFVLAVCKAFRDATKGA